jgi:endonuclease/exonuclease/phosphatase family metal-dependent hydrolase
MASRLRFMTYNMHSGRGWHPSEHKAAKPRKVAEIAEVIASYGPDVVTLQEVDIGHPPGGRDDQARQIAELLGMQSRVIASITGGVRRDYGIATLSKLPFLEAREIPMPQREHTESRCALLTRHAWSGGELEVINTHLSVLFRDRPGQVAALGAEMLGEALVIAGDFNMTPLSAAYRVLKRGFASATRFARTWPAPAAVWPIDHILFRGQLRLVSGSAWTSGGARRASDHLPLVAELERIA